MSELIIKPDNSKLVHVGLSGGGAKISALLASARIMNMRHIKPNIISGVSSGSIVAILWATGQIMNDEIKHTVLNMNLKTFFRKPPINEKGNLTAYAVKQAITGKPNLGDQSKLVDQLERFITDEVWEAYRGNPGAPVCYAGCVDFSTGSRFLVDVKQMPRDEAFSYILASSSIPVWTASVKNGSRILYDGGNRDHCPTGAIMEKYGDRISGSLSVYTRPMDYVLPEYEESGVVGALMRSIEIFNVEVSKSDEKIEKLLAKQYGIHHRIIYMPSIMKGPYDVDNSRLSMLYQAGIDNTETTLRNDG